MMANTGSDAVNESGNTANQGPAAQQPEWDSEHLQEAEKSLKEMYIQVCNPFDCFVLDSHDTAPTTSFNDPKSCRIPSHQASVP
jgi:hypothetical protein